MAEELDRIVQNNRKKWGVNTTQREGGWVWEGDPLSFMLHDNDARNHQTTGQLAAEKAITLSRAGFRNGGRWKRGTTSYLKNSNNDNSSAAEMLSHAFGGDAQERSMELRRRDFRFF